MNLKTFLDTHSSRSQWISKAKDDWLVKYQSGASHQDHQYYLEALRLTLLHDNKPAQIDDPIPKKFKEYNPHLKKFDDPTIKSYPLYNVT